MSYERIKKLNCYSENCGVATHHFLLFCAILFRQSFEAVQSQHSLICWLHSMVSDWSASYDWWNRNAENNKKFWSDGSRCNGFCCKHLQKHYLMVKYCILSMVKNKQLGCFDKELVNFFKSLCKVKVLSVKNVNH